MSKFLKLRIGTRIIFIILFVCAITVAVGTYGLSSINSINNNVNDILENSLKPTLYLGEAKSYIQRYRVSIYNHIVSRDNKELEESISLSKEYSKHVDDNLKAIGSAQLTGEERNILNKLLPLWVEYQNICDKILQESLKQTAEGKSAAVAISFNEARPKAQVIDNNLEKLLELQVNHADELKKDSIKDYSSARIITALLIIVGFAVSFTIGIILSRSIAKPLGELEGVATEIANGNLIKNAPNSKGNDEISSLSRSVHQMVNNLRDFVKHVQETAQMVAGSSQQLTSNAQQTSAAASEAAATVGEIASTMEQVAQNSQEVAALSEEASKEAEQGSQGINQVTGQMKAIATTSDMASQVVNTLSNTLSQVNQIVDLITHIADQTNLLALNAAIEAARAGEQGRGFSVVADCLWHNESRAPRNLKNRA